MAIHGCSRHCQSNFSNSCVQGYSDIGGGGGYPWMVRGLSVTLVYGDTWTVRVTLDSKVDARHNMALLDKSVAWLARVSPQQTCSS